MLDVRSASRTAGPVGDPAEGLSSAARKGVLGIVLGYAFFATLWILLSDRLAGLLFTSRSTLILISSVKGLAFVVITSILLLLTLNRYARGLVAREAGTRREEREKLHALRMLGALSEASPDPIYVKDEDGRYLLFNQAAGRAVGKDPREVVGQGDRALFPPDEAEALIAADREIMAQGVSITMEEELSTTAGRITFLATKGPIRDAEGRVCGLFGVARDITQRKQVEENLRASERKFSTVFHLSPDAIDLTLLETGILMDLNKSHLQLFGYTREELLGHSSLPGDKGLWMNREDRERHVAELKAQGVVLGFEALMRRKDGSTFLALVSSSLVEIKGELCNLSLVRDITAQKQAEQALRESNQRLELAAASGQLGIWDRNLVEDTEVWNLRMYELYGLDPAAGPRDYATWCRSIVHPEDRAATEMAVQAAIAGQGSYDLAFRALHPDGTVRHIKSNAQVLRDASGRPLRIIGINQDWTRQVQAESERQRLQTELQHAEKMESIGSLAGGVAHDMNNVLAAIMGMASTLRSSCPDLDPGAKALDTITRACSRGRDVVKSLLYFARKDLDAVGPVDLNAIAGEMVQLLRYTTLRRVQVRTDLQEPLGLIEGDAGALSHALINLCVNAVDAMPEGGTLDIRTRRDPLTRDIEISVKDDGTGMSSDVIRRSTEPFFTTKALGKGTGLGLAMVYGTVKAHGGSFEIRSQPGQGTEITLRFPPRAETEPDLAPQAPDSPSETPLGPIRILLVDDDELIRMSVAPMLTALGHDVHTAESGLEALEDLQAGLEVDLVILDMNMPGLNGAQTLARLLELRPQQSVLMATGYSDEAIAPLMEGHPNVHSLRKPFSIHEIKAKLAAISARA